MLVALTTQAVRSTSGISLRSLRLSEVFDRFVRLTPRLRTQELPPNSSDNDHDHKAEPEDRTGSCHGGSTDAIGVSVSRRKPWGGEVRNPGAAAPRCHSSFAADVLAILPDFDRRCGCLGRSLSVLDRRLQVREVPLEPSAREYASFLVAAQNNAGYRVLVSAAIVKCGEQH